PFVVREEVATCHVSFRSFTSDRSVRAKRAELDRRAMEGDQRVSSPIEPAGGHDEAPPAGSDRRKTENLDEAIPGHGPPFFGRFPGMYQLGFERWFDEALSSETEVPFVVQVGGRPVGSTRYLNIEPFHRRAEIGWTWLERPQWGTGANIETKYLLLRNAFEDWGA